MGPSPVPEKRSAKPEDDEEVFGGGGGDITELPKTEGKAKAAEAAAEAGSKGEPCAAGVAKHPESIVEDALAVGKRPRAEEEDDASSGESCAAGVTKRRPGSIEEDSLAVSKRPRTNEEDDVSSSTQQEADYDSEKEYVRQNLVYKKMLTRPHVAPGKDGKRRTVVRLDKESVEIRMSLPPPTPYPRMSEAHIERLERLQPGCRIRALEDECTAMGQKPIDRDAEMRRQYALLGYAELEFTDDEDEEEDVDERLKNWRSSAELKAAGCFDR